MKDEACPEYMLLPSGFLKIHLVPEASDGFSFVVRV